MGKTEYKPTSSTTFTVKRVGEVRESQRGDPFLECDTDLGLVAFWGGRVDQGNLDLVRAARIPFRVTCQAFKPDSTKYALWVPQRPRIAQLVELEVPRPDAQRVTQKLVSASDLATWRRSILQILGVLDGRAAGSSESVAARIARLTHERKIPREVAALMRTVTEMRNTAEYEGKVLSVAESTAVSSAWSVVREWAATQGLRNIE